MGARNATRAAALAAMLAALAALPVSAADPDPASETGEAATDLERRWLPGIALSGGYTWQEFDAAVESGSDFTDDPLRPSEKDAKWTVSPYAGVNLELMTPAITVLPGRPRFFVAGEYLPTFAPSLDVAKEGDPSGLVVPDIDIRERDENGVPFVPPICGTDLLGNPRPCSQLPTCPLGVGCFDPSIVTGAGSRVTAQVLRNVFAAGVGMAFPFEFRGRRLWLKPAFGWLRYEVDLDGRVTQLVKPLNAFPFDREVDLGFSQDESFDAIGPGLELEMEVTRWGPVQPSLYLEARAYRVVGDRKIEVSESDFQSCNGGAICKNLLGDTTYTADFSFEVDPWLYRGGVGLRLRWIGN